LSAFDARFSTQTFWEKNDRVVNNLFVGGGTNLLFQDLGVSRTELTKTAATGGQFALRQNVEYDANNRPFNIFPSAWDVNFETEVRQPLLQGAGLEFNRIAGPGAQPGFTVKSGVVLARIDHDISLADFEAAVRDQVNLVENAYWELYFAYRDLDAKIAGRDSALEAWRRAKRLLTAGGRGGDVASEAQASSQYFFFRAQVEDALSGGQNPAGALPGAGTFRAAGGIYAREAELRSLMGLPENDGRLIRPADEPTTARVLFDWSEVVDEALLRRVELRRQKWVIRRREMQFVASQNFLLPRLDAVARYRWRGFGHDLIDNSQEPGRFDNAWQTLTNGDFQEWQLGALLEIPLGQRAAFAAVKQAELQLARERAVLDEQERQVASDLAAAIRELHRAHETSKTYFNLRLRLREAVEAVRREYEAGATTIDVLLESQRHLAEAEQAYFRSVVAYNFAIKTVHYEKGSLLDYNQIYLAEGPWPAQAYDDARRRARREAAGHPFNYGLTRPGVVSAGAYQQQTMDYTTPTSPEAIETGPVEKEQPQALPEPDNALPEALEPASQHPEPTLHEVVRAIRSPLPRDLRAGPSQVMPATAIEPAGASPSNNHRDQAAMPAPTALKRQVGLPDLQRLPPIAPAVARP